MTAAMRSLDGQPSIRRAIVIRWRPLSCAPVLDKLGVALMIAKARHDRFDTIQTLSRDLGRAC